jgi:type I restriction enzyme S subunit
LKSLEFKKALKEQVPGGIKTEIKPKHILPLLVEIPTDIKEQRKVVKKLIEDNSIIENFSAELNHQLDLIKQLRQAFLREAMQGKLCHAELVSASQEKGHDLLAKIKAEKAQLIADKKLKKEKELPPIAEDEIPFEIPVHWAWCRLGEICNTITKGSSPNWQGVQYVDSPEKGILFITSKNVDSFKIDLTKATYVEEKFNEIEPRSILKKGDLLTNIVGASIGRTALYELDELANINQAVCILRIEHNLINKQFLLNLMNSNFVIELMFKMQFAPGRANLSMGNVANFTIPLPPLHEQEQIVAKLEELMAFCDGLEQSIKESQRYNEQLLQQVLREALQGNEV